MIYIKTKIVILYISVLTFSSFALDPSKLVILILNQEEDYHVAQAKLLEADIIKQSNIFQKEPPKIILTHTLDVYGSWTIVPLVAYLNDNNIFGHWYIFCTENTVIRLHNLLNTLDKYNTEIYKNLWIGHALYDKKPTIIHHFAEHSKKFKYPNLSSGFAISDQLFKILAQKATDFIASNKDFSIDAPYELSTFILSASKGAHLTHVPQFCVVSNEECATYPKPYFPCGNLPSSQNAFIAVKTCAKYHAERVNIIRNTWTKFADNIGFFTDKIDDNLLDGHIVPSTDQGHCEKTYAILKYVAPILEEKNLNWLIVTDDDTILSLSRLLKLLTCYNPENLLALGERYGYRSTKIHGYDYLTGGSSVVLSTPLVQQIIRPNVCECPSPTTPDDMYLFGVCLAHLGVKITHSPLFHQARPVDYAVAYLASQEPISFHKFWMIDPKNVYKDWFEESDNITFLSKQLNMQHTEL